MRLLALSIKGFRGIQEATFRFGEHDVLIGPNGSGKSTVIDALSLVFGRARLVRELTEHDFYGSRPGPTSRIHIVATLGCFRANDPQTNDGWFREGRAVPKWWNPKAGTAEPERSEDATTLCAQIAFAARFDLEELYVETVRYFHDDDALEDAFTHDLIQRLPVRLLDDVGYYVLPTRRTWEATASFASDLFRRAVASIGGIPAEAVLSERDRLRKPAEPLESDSSFSEFAGRINAHLEALLPEPPVFQLRVTATDSESLLRAFVAHYVEANGTSLPVGRHGTGLLSLQTFILLLELGRARRSQGKSVLFALEEPELHVPPGLQRRLIAQAVSVSEQSVCTTHSPRVAAFYPATAVQVLDRRGEELAATALLERDLEDSATNALRKLFSDQRPRVVEALMQHRVLIPEGRSEFEWFRLLGDGLETADFSLASDAGSTPPFGTVVGVVPTHDGAVAESFTALRRLRGGLVPLVDGDSAGDETIGRLLALEQTPAVVLQWAGGWAIEDVVGWILEGDRVAALSELQRRVPRTFSSIDELVALFKETSGQGRLKTNYLAYEAVASVAVTLCGCRQRVRRLLDVLTTVCVAPDAQDSSVERDERWCLEGSVVLRVSLEP